MIQKVERRQDYTIQKAPNEWKEGENLVKIPCQGGSRTAPQF